MYLFICLSTGPQILLRMQKKKQNHVTACASWCYTRDFCGNPKLTNFWMAMVVIHGKLLIGTCQYRDSRETLNYQVAIRGCTGIPLFHIYQFWSVT